MALKKEWLRCNWLMLPNLHPMLHLDKIRHGPFPCEADGEVNAHNTYRMGGGKL